MYPNSSGMQPHWVERCSPCQRELNGFVYVVCRVSKTRAPQRLAQASTRSEHPQDGLLACGLSKYSKFGLQPGLREWIATELAKAAGNRSGSVDSFTNQRQQCQCGLHSIGVCHCDSLDHAVAFFDGEERSKLIQIVPLPLRCEVFTCLFGALEGS